MPNRNNSTDQDPEPIVKRIYELRRLNNSFNKIQKIMVDDDGLNEETVKSWIYPIRCAEALAEVALKENAPVPTLAAVPPSEIFRAIDDSGSDDRMAVELLHRQYPYIDKRFILDMVKYTRRQDK